MPKPPRRPRRIRKNLDTTRLAAAAARPGIDPRVWLTWAEVVELGHDPAGDLLADVKYMPDGRPETAKIGTCYVDDGAGDYSPLDVGDTVLVAVPMGDEAFGPVIISRVWNESKRPSHSDFGDGDEPTKNRVIRMGKGRKLVIRSNGTGGDVDIQAEGFGNVNINSTGGGNTNVTSDNQVKVNGAKVILGDGGQALATVGGIGKVTLPPMACVVSGAVGFVYPLSIPTPSAAPPIDGACQLVLGVTKVEAGGS